MDEQTLAKLYKEFHKINRNSYSDDIILDLFPMAKKVLTEMKVEFNEVIEKKKPRLYLYDKEDMILRYTKSFYPNNSLFGFKIANDKMLTEKYLSYSGINTTESKIYTSMQITLANKFVNNSTDRLVMKPLSLEGGKGVFINVTKENFSYCWNECLKAQKTRKIKSPKVIIQKYVPGFEVRMIVVAGKFMSAMLRVPAHIKGDGIRTIKELIVEKNNKRKENPFLSASPIKMNAILNKNLEYKNLDLNSILDNDAFCILFPQSNTQYGGENIEVTNSIKDSVKEQCIKAVASIPGLHTSRIDMMIENFSTDLGTIIEVNKAPAFLLNYYPYIGDSYRPLEYIFKNFLLESRIMREKLDYNEINEEDFNMILERFKFIHTKQKELENIIKKMEEENVTLRNSLSTKTR